MAGGISTPGIGSGLDIGSIVSAIVNAEGAPRTANIDRREAIIQSELSALGLLKASLSDFQSALSGLSTASSFSARSASSSNADIASVSILTGQQPSTGSYKLEVQQLASAHKLISDAAVDADDIGTGTFTITTFGADKLAPSDGSDAGDGDTFSVDLATADADEDGIVSLEELKDAINDAEDNPGISASIINTDAGAQLVLNADDPGLANAFEVTSSFTGLTINNLVDTNDVNYAKDALIEIDGQAVTGSTNTFENAIDGLSLTLNATNVGQTIDINVSVTTSSIQKKIEGFVNAYNSLQSAFKDQSQFDPETTQSTPLFADSLLRSVSSQVRNGVTGPVSSSSSELNSLAAIGITTDSSGQLQIDSATLASAISSDYDGIVQLFTNDDGIAKRLDTTLDNYLKSDGTFDSRTDSLNNKLSGLEDEREALALRLGKLESRLMSQFIAMDTLVAQLNSTSDWLTSQLESLPGVVRKSKD
ncbi:flagellar filament capping protein FliD [Motiliproteus sediminis]|uniref:flagellar filament capping protein FliD n=1 Tax=Motiliproteus sediminis TaxID=1468178 RepID=UPI001AEF676E|nr:flagellar filament capping protein FliD [Motiliproteus sediminis]